MVIDIFELFLKIIFLPLNSGQNYDNQECPVFRSFTVIHFNTLIFKVIARSEFLL